MRERKMETLKQREREKDGGIEIERQKERQRFKTEIGKRKGDREQVPA